MFERAAEGERFRGQPKVLEGLTLSGPIFLPDMNTDWFQVTEVQY